jgi:hypothetical protein
MSMDLRLESDLPPEEEGSEATSDPRGRGLETLDCQTPCPHVEGFTCQFGVSFPT